MRSGVQGGAHSNLVVDPLNDVDLSILRPIISDRPQRRPRATSRGQVSYIISNEKAECQVS